MSSNDITEYLNLKKGSNTPVIGALSEYGFIERVSGGWRISDLGQRAIREEPDAVKEAFYEPLEMPKGSGTLVLTNSVELGTPFMHDSVIDFMDKRTDKKIYNRSIAEDTEFLEEIQDHDKEQLRDMTLIDPKKYPAVDRINIYGNKVSIISFKNKMVLTMESESVAQTFRSLFELAWIGAQKVGKPSPNPYVPPKK